RARLAGRRQRLVAPGPRLAHRDRLAPSVRADHRRAQAREVLVLARPGHDVRRDADAAGLVAAAHVDRAGPAAGSTPAHELAPHPSPAPPPPPAARPPAPPV